MDKDEFSFETKIESPDVYLREMIVVEHIRINFDVRPGIATVKWHLDFEARNHGIKSIGRFVDSVTCAIDWEVDKEELNRVDIDWLISLGGKEYKNEVSGVIEVDSTMPYDKKVWTISDDEFTFKSDGQCYPTDCEIDFKNMTIKIIS